VDKEKLVLNEPIAKQKMLFQELVTQNPMLIEVSRFRRRFLSFSGSSALNGIVLGLAIVCYMGLLMLVFSARGSIPPVALVMVQTFIFVLATPSMLYGAIAGEREKRTWDLLLVAPITQGQIVIGKFMGALFALGVGLALFLFPILVTAAEYEMGYGAGSRGTNWWDLFLSELVSVSFVILVAATTLFFSARTKRGFMALGTVLAVLAMFLLVVPILSTAMLPEPLLVDFINFFHPFYVLVKLLSTSEYSTMEGFQGMNASSWGLPQVIGYLALATVFIIWATRTLNFAENDVKFIPANNHA
jgi:ABC-type transport system involved in multi-copper enzyme maturation permease subunit